jgi:rhodanese-related sulfurtransferase
LATELASEKPPFVLDVRTPKEHAEGKIDQALNLPVDALRASHGVIPSDRPIVVHCAVGYRGYLAERILRQSGFSDVRNLTGGYRAWQLHQLAQSRSN